MKISLRHIIIKLELRKKVWEESTKKKKQKKNDKLSTNLHEEEKHKTFRNA